MPSPFDIYDEGSDTIDKSRGGGSVTGGFGPAGGAAAGIGAGGFYGASSTPYDRLPPVFGNKRRSIGGTLPGPVTQTIGGAPGYGKGTASSLGGGLGGGAMSPYTGMSDGGGQTFQGIPGGSDFWNWWQSSFDPNYNKTATDYVQGDLYSRIYGGGLMDPNGSQPLLDAIRSQFAQQMGGRQAGVRNQLQASGVTDPNNFALGSLLGDLQSGNDLSGQLSQAQLQSIMQNQQFLQSLFGNSIGNTQSFLQNEELQRQSKQPQQQGTNWGGILGTLGGAAVGSLFGPGGTALGSQIGGGAGGFWRGGN